MSPLRVLRASACSLLSSLILVSSSTAQIVTHSDLPEKPRLEIDPNVENGRTLSWFGREGFSYFVQTTTDLVAEPWQYLPLIETGHDAELHYGLVTAAPRFFARVVLSEQTAADPLTADFDGDGISNIDELNRMLDPVASRDDDGDGHPDDWERYYFGNTTTTNDAFADQDGDGLSDYEEAMRGTDPQLADTDGDGVLDGADGWPLHNWITQSPLPEVRYAVVPLGDIGYPVGGYPLSLDDHNNVLIALSLGYTFWHATTGQNVDLPLRDNFSVAVGGPDPFPVLWIGHYSAALLTGGAPIMYNPTLSRQGYVVGSMRDDDSRPQAVMWQFGQEAPTIIPSDGSTFGVAVNTHGVLIGWRQNSDDASDQAYSGGSILGAEAWIGNGPIQTSYSPFGISGHLVMPDYINNSGHILARTYSSIQVGEYIAEQSSGQHMPSRIAILDETGSHDLGEGGGLGLSSGLPVVAVGYGAEYEPWWAHKEQSAWVREAISLWDATAREMRPLVQSIKSMNDRFEFLTANRIIRNGASVQIRDRIPTGWYFSQASDINNHGVILARASRTIDAAGLPIPPANQVAEPVLLVPYYLAQAEGENAGRALVSGAPVYEPNDGIGKGVPIYHDPEHNLSLNFGGPLSSSTPDNATCILWGASVALTETAPASLVFQNSNASVVVTLAEEPVLDSGVLERLSVIVTAPAYDLLAASYSLAETDAGTSVFQDVLVSASVQYESLNASTIDTISLSVTDEMHSIHRTLTETASDSGVFSDEFYSVRLGGEGGGPFVPGTSGLSAFITASPVGLNNTRMNLGQASTPSGGYYRNQEPATPTDAPASTLPDHAKWKLKIGIPPALAQSLGLALKTTEAQESVSFSTTPDANGFYESVASFVMVPDHVTDTLVDGAVALKVKTDQIDWSAATGDLKLFLGAVSNGVVAASAKVQPQAIVLQSLDAATKIGQGLDTEGRIKNPMEGLGYTVYMDLQAKTPKTLSDYIIGKQVWYSMTHGAADIAGLAVGMGKFQGLNFVDYKAEKTITTTRIKDLGLNYKLVMVDGCGSAQTDDTDAGRARDTDHLMPDAREFANAFGPEAAYIGWGYTLNPLDAQTLMGEFVARLKGKPTVGASFVLYRKDMNIAERTNTNLLKLYGKRTNKVDLNYTR